MTPTPVAHFAINADDVDRAKAFYSKVFGWEFTSGGWPEFFHIDTGTEEPGHPVGSLQRRRAIVEGRPIHGFECTIAVSDLGAVTDAAEAAGGRIVMDPYSIPGVGTLIFVEDTEGNLVGAMHYDPTTGS
ncbi:MAG: VOC family protein [Actinomycetota bacterium]|nr:VOC family protein [Actinomycetota bacterium]